MRSIPALLAFAAPFTPRAQSQSQPQPSGGASITTTTKYTDPATGITFQSFSTTTGYRFGIVLPPSNSTSTHDAIIQLTSPLRNNNGWAGLSLGNHMQGPLLLTAFPSPSSPQGGQITIQPRQANGYKPDNCSPFSSSSTLQIRQIPRGTFLNGTHLTATFLCQGCLADPKIPSFDPAASDTQEFAYAYSLAGVMTGSTTAAGGEVQLAPHVNNGETYGPVGVDVKGAKSADFGRFAALADENGGSGNAGSPTAGTGTGTAGGQAPATGAAGSGSGPSTSRADVVRFRGVSPSAVVALAFAGLLHLLQAVSAF
ncbi:hypothetical protein QBC47DRAFT_435356 [Echria macrotheca]|uniref:Cellobiose dehydrogenase-like cytochrome domain-containing protein n=1 Tax=Echria macrotheca TaxID=438768 RepID=A0AAJ0B5P4_9PEZI|nr:hypothetical protein QBC47DRAFT_435356 [Echria macrotheca]